LKTPARKALEDIKEWTRGDNEDSKQVLNTATNGALDSISK